MAFEIVCGVGGLEFSNQLNLHVNIWIKFMYIPSDSERHASFINIKLAKYQKSSSQIYCWGITKFIT